MVMKKIMMYLFHLLLIPRCSKLKAAYGTFGLAPKSCGGLASAAWKENSREVFLDAAARRNSGRWQAVEIGRWVESARNVGRIVTDISSVQSHSDDEFGRGCVCYDS